MLQVQLLEVAACLEVISHSNHQEDSHYLVNNSKLNNLCLQELNNLQVKDYSVQNQWVVPLSLAACFLVQVDNNSPSNHLEDHYLEVLWLSPPNSVNSHYKVNSFHSTVSQLQVDRNQQLSTILIQIPQSLLTRTEVTRLYTQGQRPL